MAADVQQSGPGAARGTAGTWLRMVALAALVGWPLGLAVHVGRLDGPLDQRGRAIGGDFISFYTAGRLVLGGQGQRLYDLALQQRMQGQVLGVDGYDDLCSFVNPPVVAAALAPLAMLDFRVAWGLCTLMMAAALGLTLRLLTTRLPALRGCGLTVAGLAIIYCPLSISITGGQNTALSLLLLTGAFLALRDRRELLAGLLLGLLLYKPQFVLLPAALLLADRRWRALAGVALVGLGYYAVGALVCGWDWPLTMSRALSAYWPVENLYNGDTSVSLIGYCQYALPPSIYRLVALVLIFLVLTACWGAWRSTADRRGGSVALAWATVVSAAVLVSPHTQWYDLGLLLLPALLTVDVLLNRDGRLGRLTCVLLAVGLLAPAFFWTGALAGFQPLVLLPLVLMAWTLSVAAGQTSARLIQRSTLGG